MTQAGSASRIRRRRPPRDPEATMSLIAHLTELRNRIAKALLALLVATAVAFWWYDHGLGDFIRAPYCNLPADLRYGGDAGATISPRAGVVRAASFRRTSSSFMPFISPLKMRSERPSEREASGSFL